MARLVHHTRDMLPRIHRVTALPAAAQLRFHCLQTGVELALVVERRYEHVPPLVPVRVISVVAHDEPADAVVVRIDLAHFS